ncbi:MAG TPA: tetratricopeptide repeat protein, partial [Gammaproteobacteria bacterium]|nr:tetratricopeptide repeat protein [Gammaproteobacteria bacterium]
MQALDLSQNNPEDFEGKWLSLNGCNYRIGASFRAGDQGFAHLLFNEESGLCLHIIQIRPEYRSDPGLALGASRGKAEATAQLRADMRLKQPGVRIPAVSVVEAHGGSFELHEGTWGVFDNRKDAPGEAAFETAVSQLQDGDTEAAIGSLEALLEQYPNHTEALVFLAECKASLGEHVAALELVERAILIEPNSFHYLGVRVAHALNSSYRFMAMSCFEALVQRFPLIDDFNADGIQCYLDCGEPERAKALLDRSRLDDDQTRQFREVLSEASAVNAAYDAIEQKVQRPGHALTDAEKEQLVVDLKALHARYPSNPWIQANLGLMLRNTGQPESAAAFLNAAMNGLPEIWTAFCAANCGFSLAEARHWDAALSSFHT